MDGIGPSSEAYESPVLPLNYTDRKFNITFLIGKTNLKTNFALRNSFLKIMLRGPDLHGRLKVMSLANYCYSTPLIKYINRKNRKNQAYNNR
jgi:hypothetical protein